MVIKMSSVRNEDLQENQWGREENLWLIQSCFSYEIVKGTNFYGGKNE